MTEREAIRLLKTKKGQPSTDYQLAEAFDLAISALEKQEQDRRIPVTERLTEEYGDYLVTFDHRYAEGYVLDDMLLRGVRSLKHIKRRKRNETDRSNR